MPDDGEKRRIPAGLTIGLAVMVVAWIALLVILSRSQSLRREAKPQAILPVYPSATEFRHSLLPDRDWQTATYSVGLDYPSLEVFYYYDGEMRDQGWTRDGSPDVPQWHVSQEGAKGRRATFMAAWISPDALLRVELNLQWEEPASGGQARRGERRGEARLAPGDDEGEGHMLVTATMSRTVLPMSAPREGQTPLAK